MPAYWTDAAAAWTPAARTPGCWRSPGSNFAAYRWGNAVDPILPGLIERGQLAREVLPQGSASSALLLDALDRRLQQGTLEPAALAPVARLLRRRRRRAPVRPRVRAVPHARTRVPCGTS